MLSADTKIRSGPKPPSPPPSAMPQYCPFMKNTGSEYIRQHLNYFIYVWTVYGNAFWIFPVDIVGNVMFCYAWDGTVWKYIQLDLKLIDSFH